MNWGLNFFFPLIIGISAGTHTLIMINLCCVIIALDVYGLWTLSCCSIYHILMISTMLIGWYVWELSQSLGMSNKLGFNNFRGKGNNLCPFWIFKILNKLQFHPHPDNPFVWDHICSNSQLFKKHMWVEDWVI